LRRHLRLGPLQLPAARRAGLLRGPPRPPLPAGDAPLRLAFLPEDDAGTAAPLPLPRRSEPGLRATERGRAPLAAHRPGRDPGAAARLPRRPQLPAAQRLPGVSAGAGGVEGPATPLWDRADPLSERSRSRRQSPP